MLARRSLPRAAARWRRSRRQLSRWKITPLFNAGRGAVFTWDGENELDASIMDGRDRSAGAVTGVTTVRNPILLADKVRTDSPHVFLMGEGAEQFASEQRI